MVGRRFNCNEQLIAHATGREIPEDFARKTDYVNEFPNEMWQKFGEAGFLGITADEEYGGLGMGYQAHCVVMEEISRASGGSRCLRFPRISKANSLKAASVSHTRHIPSFASISSCSMVRLNRKRSIFLG